MDKKFKSDFLKGSAAASIGTIVSMSFHFVSFMILTRILPKEELGIFVLILALIQLFSLLSGLGLEITVVKFISGEDKQKKEVLLPVIVLKTLLLIIFALAFYIGGSFTINLFGQEIADYFILIPFIFIAAGLRDLFYNVLQGLNYFKKYAISQSATAAIRLLLIGLFIYLDELTIANLIYIELYTTVGAVLLQLFLIPFKNLITFPGIEVYIRLLKFSIPLYMNNVLTFVYDRVNIFIIGAYLNTASIALYDVASRIPEALKRIYQSFIVVYFPNLSKLFAKDNKEGAVQLINKSLLFSSFALTMITLISFFFAEEIVTLIFSETYRESGFAFALLVVNFYMRALSNLLGYSLVSAGFSSVPVKVNILSSIISVAGSILLIPVVGYIGAVYSLLLMNAVSLYLFSYHLHKRDIAHSKESAKSFVILAGVLGIYFLIQSDDLLIKLLLTAIFLFFHWLWFTDVKDWIRFLTKYLKINSLY